MIRRDSRLSMFGLLLAIILAGSTDTYAQRTGGGGGGGFGGGGGGFGGGGGGGTGGRGGTTGTGTRDYGNATALNNDAMITVDPETRNVIIAADEATWMNVSNVLHNLDRPKPQVLINAVFVEVTHDKESDIGFEASYARSFNPSSAINSVGLTNLFNLQNLGATGQQIGQTTMPPGAGLYSIAGSSFAANMRAIQGSGKTEVLSRPSVLVRNNQPATITVGQSIPIATSVTYNSLGNPITSATYQSVGIILQVTPFITPDGLVEMIVAPQISALTDQNITIAQGVSEPVISLRSANTVVVTPNGQTVIIGGLMEHDNTKVDSKIPLLGDIPGIGFLFHHKQSANTKTELLIFITPHVIASPMDVAAMSQVEGNKAELPGKAFSEKELNDFIDGQPLKGQGKSGK